MDLTAWALYLLATVAVLAGTATHYRRREPAGRGRYVLVALRGGALALGLLLLFNPAVPSWTPGVAPPTVALVDASLSMSLRAPDGRTRWEEAERVVAELDPDVILVFGRAEARRVVSLAAVRPDQPGGRLGPALRSALEAGAGRVVVVTDGAIEDPDEVGRGGRVATAAVEFRAVGERTAGNLGLMELEAPRWAEVGEEVAVRAGVARLGEAVADSVDIVLRWTDRELARARVSTPGEGRVEPATLRFTPPAGMDGLVRLDAVLEGEDAVPADDARSAYVTVADAPAGVAMVSFRADQEPRFLLPVLERALGLPVRGWLGIGEERFVRIGAGPEAGQVAEAADVRRALSDADLVVLHGMSEGSPEWALAAARQAERALLFPAATLDVLPLDPGALRAGAWYVVEELPSSPVRPFLAGLAVEQAPPLPAIRPAPLPSEWWTPLLARQDRRGEAVPLLAAREMRDRRVALALGEGFWRWGFDEGIGRSLYDALWAGVASWLVADAPARVAELVRPEPRVIPRGEPVRWMVPAGTDSVRVVLHPVPGPVAPWSDVDPAPVLGAEVMDTVVMARDGAAGHEAPPPGHYRYQVRAFLSREESVAGAGELTVESYSPEFTRPARALTADTGAESGTPMASARAGRPLRTMAWPFVAIVVLLCVEWVLRRRWGLR